MFKRCMALLLVLVLVTGLVACGNKEDKTPTEPEVQETQPTVTPIEPPPTDNENQDDENTESTTPSEPEDVEQPTTEPEVTEPVEELPVDWKTEFLDTPILPALRVDSRALVPGIYVKIAATPFSFNTETLASQISGLDFIKQNYSSLSKRSFEAWDAQYYENGGHTMSYAGNDEFIAAIKSNRNQKFYEHSDLVIGAARDSAHYSNYHSLYVDMKNLPAKAVTQSAIKSVADVVFDDWAYYMVYAEDMDDSDLEGKRLSKGHLCESITASDGTIYCFTRKITENDDGTINVYLSVNVYHNPFKNSRTTFGGDVKSVYMQFTKPIKDVVSKSFGSTELLEYRTFGAAYFNAQNSDAGYVATEINKLETTLIISPDKYRYYDLSSEFVGIYENGQKGSTVAIDYSFVELDKLQDAHFTISGTTNLFDNLVDVTDRDKAGKMIMADIENSISLIFDNASTGSLTFDESQVNSKAPYEKSYSISGNIFNRETTARVNVKMGAVGDIAEGALNCGTYVITISL